MDDYFFYPLNDSSFYCFGNYLYLIDKNFSDTPAAEMKPTYIKVCKSFFGLEYDIDVETQEMDFIFFQPNKRVLMFFNEDTGRMVIQHSAFEEELD